MYGQYHLIVYMYYNITIIALATFNKLANKAIASAQDLHTVDTKALEGAMQKVRSIIFVHVTAINEDYCILLVG